MAREPGLNKRELQREKMRRVKQRDRQKLIGIVTVVALLFVGLLIAPNLVSVGNIATPESTHNRPQINDNGMGDPNAPVKLEEFSDFQCPYCAQFSIQTEAQLINAYVETGQVYFVYRSFGEFIGTESRAAAETAYCAGDQGKFWEMHDLLFANQTGENVGNFTNKRLTAFAEKLGLDMGKFTTCFNGGTYSDRVDQDAVDGLAAGIKATPSFVLTYTVGGQTKTVLIEGAVPFDNPSSQQDFKRAIDTALAEIAASQ
jgi:protein-disulfide isomerase